MNIKPFRTCDIAPFLKLAAAEKWVAEPWEFEFLLSRFPQGCFAALADNGDIAGFVTSLHNDCSGWIGNLIVSPEYRGQRIGEGLFVSALDALRAAGVETVWLTASKAGLPLYEKHGFTRIDTIIRWIGTGRQLHAVREPRDNRNISDSSASGIDSKAWGDRRDVLLAATAERGRLLLEESGFVVVQPCGDSLQIGPFSALDDGTADILLKFALRTVPIGTRVCLDAPALNRAALQLFNRKRLHFAGSNELMYAGVKPAYRPEYIYGLATMGSCG